MSGWSITKHIIFPKQVKGANSKLWHGGIILVLKEAYTSVTPIFHGVFPSCLDNPKFRSCVHHISDVMPKNVLGIWSPVRLSVPIHRKTKTRDWNQQ